LLSHWPNPSAVLRGPLNPRSFADTHRWPKFKNFEEQMMYMDTINYLPNDILAKVDRASMAASLEARVPLLDHRVVEFAWRLPLDFKIRNSRGKWLIREVLDRYVPRHLVERPKAGFGVPLDAWLRGPLREWAESLLEPRRLRGEGFFDPEPIREKWNEHISGARSWQYQLWDILMFQAWYDQVRSESNLMNVAHHTP
jgi:asparagine synthase (glutamine-hydrolysing)